MDLRQASSVYKRDKVDLLQIHEAEQAGWDGIFGAGRTLETLLEIQEQGLTQHIGLTGSDLELMRDGLKESDVFVSVITFLKYDLLTQQAKEILVPTAAERDVAVITASPLHAGLLGSKRELWTQSGRFADLHDKLEQVETLLAGSTRRHHSYCPALSPIRFASVYSTIGGGVH